MPTYNKIEELLEKLKELDPKTFDEWRYVYRGNLEGTEYSGVKLERTDLWLLQGVIQEAIAAWELSWDVYAVAGENVRGSISLDKKKIDFSGWAATPTGALLRAYVAALEAMR